MMENIVHRKSKILSISLFAFPISDSESNSKDFSKVSTILWPRYQLGLGVIGQKLSCMLQQSFLEMTDLRLDSLSQCQFITGNRN